jgi:hypothetical protein
MIKVWVLFLALGTGGPLNAQTIWRCGSDGRTYSDQPCSEGRALVGTDARSVTEVRAAHEVVARDQALARELHRQNREAEREALSHGSGLAGITAPPPTLKPKVSKPPRSKSKKQPAEGPEIWRAVARASR